MEKKMENEMETGLIEGVIGIRNDKGFPKSGVPLWGVPILVCRGTGSPYLGKLAHVS